MNSAAFVLGIAGTVSDTNRDIFVGEQVEILAGAAPSFLLMFCGIRLRVTLGTPRDPVRCTGRPITFLQSRLRIAEDASTLGVSQQQAYRRDQAITWICACQNLSGQAGPATYKPTQYKMRDLR